MRINKELQLLHQQMLSNKVLNEKEIEVLIEELLSLYDRYNKHLIDLIYKQLFPFINDYDTIDEKILMLNDVSLTGKVPNRNISSLAVIQSEVTKSIVELVKLQDELVVPTMHKTIYNNYLRDSYHLKAFKGELEESFRGLPQDEIEMITYRKWFGGNYFSRSVNNSEYMAQKISKILEDGAIQGYPITHMMNQLRDELNIGKRAARTLVQSEVSFVQEQARIVAMQDAGVTKYQYLATLETNTCKLCRDYDSKIFEISEARVGENYPPKHGNCRCTVVAVFEGIDFRGKKRAMRDPVTGKTKLVNWVTYDEWLKRYVNNA